MTINEPNVDHALLAKIAEQAKKIAKLRAALKRIADGTHPAKAGSSPYRDAQAFAKEALK